MENSQVQKQNKEALFRIRHLKKYFPIKKKSFSRTQDYVHANESITLDIYKGETLGLVGESGCGKSTFGRTLLQIYPATSGSILYYGATIADVNPAYARHAIRQIPKIFPLYLVEKKEMDELLSRQDQLAEGATDAELDEKILNKSRELENKFANMLRIAGGLLAHKDLEKVSAALMAQFEADVAVAKVRNEIRNLEIQKELSPTAAAEDVKKIHELEAKLPSLEATAASKKEAVEALREEARNEANFDELEAEKDEGLDLNKLSRDEIRPLRKDMQIIFQDPYSSLDTRMTLGNIIGEGVIAHGMLPRAKGEEYNSYIQEVMGECGLAPYFIHRYPHQFSGGQRQRIGIARALAVKPGFVVCDEAVSALDVSIQSQIINLLSDLKRDRQLTYLFITHDLSVVKYISDRIAVMYLGMLVELTDSDKLFAKPLHPYTQALLKAIPRTDVENQEISVLEGDIPSAVHPPEGCRFHTRCIYCMENCSHFEPALREVEEGHFVACHLLDMPEEERRSYMAQKEAEDLARSHELDAKAREALAQHAAAQVK